MREKELLIDELFAKIFVIDVEIQIRMIIKNVCVEKGIIFV